MLATLTMTNHAESMSLPASAGDLISAEHRVDSHWGDESDGLAPRSPENSSPLHEQQSVPGPLSESSVTCDACLFCNDTCGNLACPKCSSKKGSSFTKNQKQQQKQPCCFVPGPAAQVGIEREPCFTMCQVRRHDHRQSAWLVAGDTIYDATKFISCHPGGQQAILKRAGGAADCTEDMKFHSRTAVKRWKNEKVGKLVQCPGDSQQSAATDDGCIIS